MSKVQAFKLAAATQASLLITLPAPVLKPVNQANTLILQVATV